MKLPTDMESMIKQAGQLKEKFEKLQAEAGDKKVEASSGGGMVMVVAKAKGEVVSLKLEPEIVDTDEIEMLQDLITAAVNEALSRGRSLLKEEMSKAASGLCCPPGLI